jgi:hypothetical protein
VWYVSVVLNFTPALSPTFHSSMNKISTSNPISVAVHAFDFINLSVRRLDLISDKISKYFHFPSLP